MNLPHELQNWLAQRGEIILDARAVGGGEICHAAQIVTDRARYFVKWQKSPKLTQMFSGEAQSLRVLRATECLSVPQVLAATAEFLVLEWIEKGADSAVGQARLGAQLAQQHRHSAPQFGFEADTHLGRWRQPNAWRATWSEFLRENRLRPLLALARDLELLPPDLDKRLARIVENTAHYLPGLESVPSLLHGDLWSGNFLIDKRAQPFVFDACAYYGEREIEIAYCELFGGFHREFYRAYNAEWPLSDGYERRRDLHQLVHLLNHLNHFGRAYLERVEAVCRKLDLLHKCQ